MVGNNNIKMENTQIISSNKTLNNMAIDLNIYKGERI